MAARLPALTCALALLAAPAPGFAQGLAQGLSLDLNATHPRDGACQLVFVGQNGTGADIAQLVLETVLFDPEGRVAAMTLLDLQDLPAGRLRVRSFEIGGLDCDGIGRLLINGISTCLPAETPGCAAELSATTSTGIEVLQ
jgi:hypothetical protein